MQKYFLLPLIFILNNFTANLTAFSEQHFSNFSYGKRYERYLRLKSLVASQNFDNFENESYWIPTIHNSPWPYFCLNHLFLDSQGCSSWCLDDKNELQLDFNRYGFAETYIDKSLIERIGEKYCFIPLNEEEICDYGTCDVCQSGIFHGFYADKYLEGDINTGCWEENDAHIFYRCKCFDSGYWHSIYVGAIEDSEHHSHYRYHQVIENKYPDWQFCKNATVYPGYFNWHYQTYFHFFENFLIYLESNPSCSCYWAECSLADLISLTVFNELDRLLSFTNFDQIRTSDPPFSPFLENLSRENFIRGLFTHAFFYSHYLSILNDLDRFSSLTCNLSEHQKIYKSLKETLEEIQPHFIDIYSKCLKKHPHPKIYYERGMVHFHCGQNIESFADIQEFIAYAEENHLEEFLTSPLYLQEGKLLNEMLSYDEAIVSLTKSIAKDPKNKEAYFERAIAYFEIGNLTSAINDYTESEIKPTLIDKRASLSYLKFSQGIGLGMAKGGMDSAIDFVPSLFSTVYGLGKGLWVFASNPVGVSKELVDGCCACIEFIKDNISPELLLQIVPELKECIEKWDQLKDEKKGYYIGYIIGHYGVDILAWGGCARGIKLFRDIKRANTVLTLESAAISAINRRELTEASKQFFEWRTAFKKKCQLHTGQQEKHIPGTNNFQRGKSELTVSIKKIEKLTHPKIGEGIPTKVSFGEAGYREIVDFGEEIGVYVTKDGKVRMPTSIGEIHYKQNGKYHVVPIKPDRVF